MSATENKNDKPTTDATVEEEHAEEGEAYGAYEAENFGPEGDNSKNQE